MRRTESAHAPTLRPGLARTADQLTAASEAVEVLALTTDHDMLTTLRNSVSAEKRRIWHAPGFQEAAELIMAGRVGVAIIDTATTGAETGILCERFRSQFPDLVLIVAGTGEDQARLIAPITSGDIYRFLHKPLSEARAHQFIETSVRRHITGRTVSLNHNGPTVRLPLKPVLATAAVVLVVIIAAVFMFSSDDAPAPAEQQTATNNLPPTAADAKEYSSQPEQPESASTAAPTNSTRTGAKASSNGNASSTAAATLNSRSNNANANAARSTPAAQSAAPATESSTTTNADRRETTEATPPAVVAAQTPAPAESPPAVIATTQPPADTVVAKTADQQTESAANKEPPASDAATPPESAPVVVTIEKPAAPAPQPTAPAIDPRAAFLANIVPATSLPRTRQIEPQYPFRARREGINGWVELDFTVDAKGSVKDISVRDAAPRGVFEKSASDALTQWRFKPVIRDGRAVEQRSHVRLRFQLEN